MDINVPTTGGHLTHGNSIGWCSLNVFPKICRVIERNSIVWCHVVVDVSLFSDVPSFIVCPLLLSWLWLTLQSQLLVNLV